MSLFLSVDGAQQGSSYLSNVAVPMAKHSANATICCEANGSLTLWVKS
jgi:hypothetical protein